MRKSIRQSIRTIKKRLHRGKSGTRRDGEADKLAADAGLERVKREFDGFDKNHVWCFMAGQAGQDFRGNPKYLFAYICKYRPDIRAYWLCENEDTLQLVRSLGFIALNTTTAAAQYAINRTGVVVAEQVRLALPDGLEDVKYLNLWHGIGFKNVERTLFQGDIAMGLARKYVKLTAYYEDRELVIVTCPEIEQEHYADFGLAKDRYIRSGYVRCEYQNNFEPVVTYEHDLRKVKGLTEDAKYVVYAPTYRAELGGTFAKAIKDIELLYSFCEENNILFIFKMHPNMESEVGFLNARDTYGDRKHFWFWDNQDDFYEIMDQMDLAIVDYSAITSDMIAMGIPHFIRYIYDYDEYTSTVDVHDAYFERTTGAVCRDFYELLDAMKTFENRDESEEIGHLRKTLWSYSNGKGDFDKIIRATMDFKIEKKAHQNLYSFDIFDTLFSRRVLDPIGVFYGVKEKMEEHGGFPYDLTKCYPDIRHTAEFCERAYYRKTQDVRGSDHIEVTLEDILRRIKNVYGLDDEQTALLRQWELNLELENVVPLRDQISKVHSLVENGETVLLISDMYLPRSQIKSMLRKADPLLETLPLYLSNEYGVLKTDQRLFFEVYKSLQPDYHYSMWIHYGDNNNADVKQPRRFMIDAREIEKPVFNEYQEMLVKLVQNYDAYLVAAVQARMCFANHYKWDEFVISFVTMCMVPYVDWVLRDAERRGYETLYFVSRDGHHLKRIADAIIAVRDLPFKTRLIYASRRVWRVPSNVHEVDHGFWESYGNFGKVASVDKLLRALHLDESTFHEMFPSVNLEDVDFLDLEKFSALVGLFRNSKEYNDYLLEIAAQERVIVNDYLLQEINPSERFAVVEYYGRGYNQECMIRLWRDATGDPDADIPYYYARSILQSAEGCTRYNFTTNTAPQYFIEAIFANMPYKSIEGYERKGDRVVPVIEPMPHNRDLFESMERLLPVFAEKFAALGMHHPEGTDRMLFDYVFEYYKENVDNPRFAETLGTLVDSTLAYGEKREFAPKLSEQNLEDFRNRVVKRNSWYVTSNITMSVARSEQHIASAYKDMYQIMPGEKLNRGKLLTEERESQNRSWRNKFYAMDKCTSAWRDAYAQAVTRVSVERKVLFVAGGKSLKSKAIRMVVDGLSANGTMPVDILCLGKQDAVISTDVADRLASAAYIIVEKPVEALSRIAWREGSKLVLLSATPFSLYRKGLRQTFRLSWQQKYADEFGANDFDVLQVPSAGQEDRFRNDYMATGAVAEYLDGSCATDIYFANGQAACREKLGEVFPESRGKKVILYMPKLRPRNSNAKWANLLDLGVLCELLGDEYVVVFNYVKATGKEYVNLGDISGFSKTISEKQMPLRELMIAADVIVGDYRATFFESALLHKPTYFTVRDYPEMMRTANIDLSDLCEFENLIFGPVISSAGELVAELRNSELFSYSAMERVKQLLFSGCNGNSIKKVVEFLES